MLSPFFSNKGALRKLIFSAILIPIVATRNIKLWISSICFFCKTSEIICLYS